MSVGRRGPLLILPIRTVRSCGFPKVVHLQRISSKLKIQSTTSLSYRASSEAHSDMSLASRLRMTHLSYLAENKIIATPPKYG